MEKVMVFGTFDLLHKGHINFFKQAKTHGTLVVVVGRDANVKKIKGSLPANSEQARIAAIKKLNIAEEVILGKTGNWFKLIEEMKPEIICLGYDQNDFGLVKENEERGWGIKIIRMKPFKPEMYKSSILKKCK